MPTLLTRRTVSAGLAAAVAMPAPLRAANGTRLRIGMPSYPATLDPITIYLTPGLRTLPNVFESLIDFDFRRNYALRPALAESWHRVDSHRVRFRLRPDVRFHDGGLMTAADVVFSLGAQRRQGVPGVFGSIAAPFQGSISDVVAVGDRDVDIVTAYPDPMLEQKLAAWSCQIVSRSAFEAAGSWPDWLRRPIGTGPYRIVDAQSDTRLLLAAHDVYWGGRPAWREIEFRSINQLSSRIASLQAGDLDLITDVTPDHFQTLATGELEVVGGELPQYRIVGFDSTWGPLRDARLRRALSLAVDRDAITAGLWGGRVAVPRGPQVPAYGDTYLEDMPRPGFNLAEARRLVRDSGYTGEVIPYRIQPAYYPNQLLTAQVLVEQWGAAGIRVELAVLENFSQVFTRPIQAIFDYSISMAWPDVTGMLWRLWGKQAIFQSKFQVWSNAEFNRLGEQMERSFDVAERRQLHRRILEIVTHDDPPFLILHNNGAFYGRRRGVTWAPASTLLMEFGPRSTN